jgi:hypothetical protein
VRKIVGLAIALLLTVGVGQAAALPFVLTFTATVPGYPGSPISGSFNYDAASITAPVNALTAVNLTLDGQVYTLADTGFENGVSVSVIGGLLNGAPVVAAGTNDFYLSFDRVTGQPLEFVGASPSLPLTNPTSSGFPSFTIAPAAVVPEPASVALVALGLAGLGFRRLRKRG